MKQRDVQRSVKSTRVDRSAGDAPAIGRVSRVPGTGRAKGMRRRRRHNEGGQSRQSSQYRQRVLVAWSALLVIVTVIVMSVAIWFWTADNMNRGVVEPDRQDSGARERVDSKFKSPTREEALELVKSALRVRTEDEVARFFRPGGHASGEILTFLNERVEKDGRDEQFLWASSVDANGLLIDGVEVLSKKGDQTKSRIALLTPDAQGRWLMDYEAFARPMVRPWRELLDGATAEATVRVLIQADHYFNGHFDDESRWASYRLTALDVEAPLYGYCAKNTPQWKALVEVLSKVDRSVESVPALRVTLRIVRPEGAEPTQFEIQRVLAEDWIVSDKNFDENYH